jgi:putative hemolysin
MEILFIFILMLLNGFFSMAEIALVSARKSRLETSAKKGSTSAKAALELINKPNKLLSTVQIGITLIGLLTGIYSGENIVEDLTPFIERFESLQPFAHGIAVVVILVIVTFFSLVLGELVPKRIGLANPEAISKIAATPIKIMSIITAPFVWLLTGTTELLLKIFRIKPSMESKVTEEEIKAIVQEGAETGEVEQIEQDIVTRVFSLGDRKAKALMTHRKNVVFLSLNDDVETINRIVNIELHSVYPVYKTDKDVVEGIVLLKDLYAHINKPDFSLKNYLHTPQFINEHRTAYDALELFKKTKIRYGVVVDEIGQTQGLITMNDILEALVADVSELYADEYKIVERADGSWLVDGHYPFYDFLVYFGLAEIAGDYGDFTTVAGLILNQLSHIPTAGDTLIWLDFEIEVIDMDGARIDKILLKKLG